MTDEFDEALDDLIDCLREITTVVMCAEKVYWRCHRRIIADYLVARGYNVTHIIEPDRTIEHEMTEFAEVEDDKITYPAPE